MLECRCLFRSLRILHGLMIEWCSAHRQVRSPSGSTFNLLTNETVIGYYALLHNVLGYLKMAQSLLSDRQQTGV